MYIILSETIKRFCRKTDLCTFEWYINQIHQEKPYDLLQIGNNERNAFQYVSKHNTR